MTVREPSAASSDDSAVNWPEAPAYSYRGAEAHAASLMGGSMIMFALITLALAGFHEVSGVPGIHRVYGFRVASIGLAALEHVPFKQIHFPSSSPRKRGPRASDVPVALGPRFRGDDEKVDRFERAPL
jgi:hypothetical protein